MASSRTITTGRESKVFDERCMYQMENKPLSHSIINGRISRMSSGVSDMVEEFFRTEDDLEAAAEAANFFMEDLPSENSDLFHTGDFAPQSLAFLPPPVEFCPKCGRECFQQEASWRCLSTNCLGGKERNVCYKKGNLEIDGSPTQSIGLEQKIIHIKKKPEDFDHDYPQTCNKDNLMTITDIKKEMTKEEMQRQLTPRQYSLSPPTSPTCMSPKHRKRSPSPLPKQKMNTRRKTYKVESTPPINKYGLRHCTMCSGQVRPQMCGAHKHRWRCVDKRCRKWYGWVNTGEEIPSDLGRKGRYNSVLGKQKPKEKVSRRFSTRVDHLNFFSVSLVLKPDPTEPFLPAGYKDTVNTSSSSPTKPTVDKNFNSKQDSNGNTKITQKKDDTKREVGKRQSRALSPLNFKQLAYFPCSMEQRGRWWTNEKRRNDPSPERELRTTMADISAALYVLAEAAKSAALTRADEVGTVNGALDLLMDSLMGSMAPILSAFAKLPNVQVDPQVINQMWNASAVHIPIFR